MAEFTAADVKRLRDATGAGMMDCKKALTEADGDYDKAVEFLRIKGAKDVGKRLERSTTNGVVVSKDGALLELDCETDFVAKNADFVTLAERLLDDRPDRASRPTSSAAGHRGRRPDRRRAGRGRVGPHRREAGAQPVRRLRGHHRHLPAQAGHRPAPGHRCRRAVQRRQRGRRAQPGDAHRRRPPALPHPRGGPGRGGRDRAPRRRADREGGGQARAGDQPRSSRVGSTPTTRTSSCSSSRRSPSPSAR